MKRWPIIRHVRYWWLSYRVHRWAIDCFHLGLGLGHPNPSDLRMLELIWEGKA